MKVLFFYYAALTLFLSFAIKNAPPIAPIAPNAKNTKVKSLPPSSLLFVLLPLLVLPSSTSSLLIYPSTSIPIKTYFYDKYL